jgi:hypothetical protein
MCTLWAILGRQPESESAFKTTIHAVRSSDRA